jgi:hypothetical protein
VLAVRAVGVDGLVAEVVVSNPAFCMNVCLCLSVLCCPVSVDALRRAYHPSKESCQLPK